MTDEGMFSFEDAAIVVCPMATSPLSDSGDPRAFTSPASMQPSPGTLFGNSPIPASGVTRGERRKKRELGWYVRVPTEICGGVIGAMENKKFCATLPSQCEHCLTHSKRKFDLKPDTLYVMSSKKGGTHATLLPKLDVNCIPADKELVDLLNDERPVAMRHIYIDGCNTVEETTCQNELEVPNDVSWEAIKCPSLEDLERANYFKTPRKVRLMPGFVDATYTYEMFTLGHIEPLLTPS
jgi:hypothetical protein